VCLFHTKIVLNDQRIDANSGHLNSIFRRQ
jgi:hypothetical protein